MATKEKIKKKKDVAKLAEQVSLKDERPGSAQSQGSQVSVKEADIKNVTDNTDEKFKQDESKQEKEDNKTNEEKQNENVDNPSPPPKSASEEKKETKQKSKLAGKAEKPDKKTKNQQPTPQPPAAKQEEKSHEKKDKDNKIKKKGKDKKSEITLQPSKERTPSPAPSLNVADDQRRTPSPFRKNTVEPANTQGSNTNLGSAASLKSYTSSVKEAWTDKSDVASVSSGTVNNSTTKHKGDGNVHGSSANAKQSKATNSNSDVKGSTVSVREGRKRNQVGCIENEETWTIKSGEEDSPEQHAYVPYLYAKKCIAGIMNDMKLMKTTHVRIVEDIQVQYKAIEDETQSQFNTYIVTLREHYSNKVHTFRQVIDIHRTDLDKKEAYWNEMLASLAERNNRLLRERKTLLIRSKEEIERLEKEKEEQRREYTDQLDKANAVVVAAGAVSGLESELKQTKDQLEKEKQEVVRLQGLLAAAETGGSTTTTKDRKKSVTKETATKSAVVAAAVVVDKNEKEKMSSERGHMEDERNKISEERLQMDEDRKNFGDERKKWMDEVNILQVKLAAQAKESEEWKAKYESMKSRLEQVATVQAKYKALESQYAALAAVVTTNEATKQAAEENAKKTQDDKNMMEKEQHNLESEIKKWEKDFKKKNGRPPTEDDKSDSVKEMYVQKEELNVMVTSLDQKLETYKDLEQGKVPDPPQVAPVPVDIKDPEIKTVEVKVPDPMILEELKKAQMEIERLRAQILALQQENMDQNNQITQQNEELSNQRDRIRELEAEIANLKAAAVVASASAANSEELENLKTENRELRTDMKKMLKKVEHYEEKEKTAMQDPDTRIQTLEEKVTGLDDKVLDLESENEALKDSQKKLTTEKENLMQQITALQQQIATGTGSPSVVAAVPVNASAGGGEGDQDCGVIGHADLVKQLEAKTREVEEKEIQIKELDQRIEEKDQELEKLKDEIKDMRKDMIKMAKQQSKLTQKLKELDDFERTRKLLEAVIHYVHHIHGDIPPAGEAVTEKLIKTDEEAKPFLAAKEKDQKAVNSWVDKFKKKHGREPSNKDRDGEAEKLYKALEDSNKELQDQKIKVEALKIMKTGDYKADQLKRRKSVTSLIQPEESAVEKIETQMSALDNKVTDLELENDTLKKDKLDLQSKIRELEADVKEARNQAELQASLAVGDQDTEELSSQITNLQKQVDAVEASLIQERAAHDNTKDELENLRKQMEITKEESANQKSNTEAEMDTLKKNMVAEIKARDEEMERMKSRNDDLEKERLANLPVDTANEIKNLQAKIELLEKEKSTTGTASSALQNQISELKTKLEASNKNLEAQRSANRELEGKVKNNKTDKDKAVKEMAVQMEKKEQQRTSEDKKRIGTLERRIKELESSGVKPAAGVAVAAAGKGGASDKAFRDQIAALKRENNELNTRIRQLETELRRGGGAAVSSTDDKNEIKRKEKILKELEKKYEIEKKKTERLDENLKTTEDDLKVTKKDRDDKENELKKVKAELTTLGAAAKEGVEAATKVKTLEGENKSLVAENKVLTENFNSERVLRKKYYNMVEDMKGKIRVYCRARPLSGSELERKNYSVLKSPDEYSIQVESTRGTKEFQFDQVFMEESTQEKIFEDTHNLIQSAVDGYNVCIFAYGQTGSGKTFTMIGDREQKFPGIAPRAFQGIFELIQEQKNKYTITVQAYMLELYNEKLIDLFAKPGTSDDEKMEIKKDKRGLVYVQGSVIKDAHNAKELMALFEEGSKNRHTASTKMNQESSRSHLVIGITMESTNKTTGQVLKGKLSLVDLAGSERVGKTGATAEQLKEAMSINKSLSALGDVISALSSEQQFIPYRNNKLTMLMQDSMGGNAKTLMFVNISPADYNQEETVISLTYASRVKLITNDASKNADNKEVARLKAIISKMKKGEVVDEEL